MQDQPSSTAAVIGAEMNALEDTRELVTSTSGPWPHDATRHAFIAGFVSDLIREYPDVELSSIRITELAGILTIIGRRGPLTTDECPSCHTTAGHPHTDYCRTENREYPGQPAAIFVACAECLHDLNQPAPPTCMNGAHPSHTHVDGPDSP